ncbi:MAG: hypothetical protein ABSF43_13135 [Rectinemataceae bacterium]|jgi:hypothetical protein
MKTQSPVQINLGFDQIQAIIDQMPEADKERLAAYLDRQTVAGRIERFQQGVANFPLSDEEIQAEVKVVRQERHAAGRR